MARRSAFAYGSGRSSSAFTTVKMAVFAPMPIASDRIATAAKPGLWTSARSATVTSSGDGLRDVLAERRRQVELMLLLLPQNLADVLGDGVLLERLAFLDALAVGANRIVLVLQIGAQHLLRRPR